MEVTQEDAIKRWAESIANLRAENEYLKKQVDKLQKEIDELKPGKEKAMIEPTIDDQLSEEENDLARNEFALLKYQIGHIITEKFLEYNEGKFHTGIELNPVTHAITEFVFRQVESFKNQLQAARQTNIINGNYLNGIIAELEKLIEKAFVSGRSKQSWESFKKENGL